MRELFYHRAGSAAIEMALISPVIILLLTGLADFGLTIYDRMRLVSAVRAGVQYAMHHSADPDIIKQTVTGALGVDGVDASVTVNQLYECPDGTVIDESSSCGANTKRLVFVQIAVTYPHHTLFEYPLIPNPIGLEAKAEVRIE